MRKQEQSTGNDGFTLALKPMEAEPTEVRNREYQWLHQIVICHRKKLKKNKKNPYSDLLNLLCKRRWLQCY